MSDDPQAPELAATTELEAGLRFLHLLGMQTKLSLAEAELRTHAVLEELVARGLVSLRSIEARVERLRKEPDPKAEQQATIHVASIQDKYALQSPDVDCASLIPLCKGRCCRLTFPLSFQDLDEHVVKWNYSHPYHIRHRETDGYCVHSDPTTRGCGVYQNRPGICRTYDCRTDKRIWTDFENRVPAPWDAISLVNIRVPKAKKDSEESMETPPPRAPSVGG